MNVEKTFGQFAHERFSKNVLSCAVWKMCSQVSLREAAVEMLVCVWADCNSTLL